MPDPRPGNRLIRASWLALGLFFVGLGIIGAILPLMPTTIFLILAAGCFARSSPRLEKWLLDHKVFGPTLRAWRADGAISRRASSAAGWSDDVMGSLSKVGGFQRVRGGATAVMTLPEVRRCRS